MAWVTGGWRAGDFALTLVEFFSDLKSILGVDALKRVGRKALGDDCLGLAGQLAYFTLLSLFPFLMFMVSVAGLAVNNPASVLETLTERMGGFLPEDAVGLLTTGAMPHAYAT